jgi:GNAT superfamily N-acetyltransferase
MSTGVAISDINWAWNENPLSDESRNAVLEIKDFYKTLGLRFWWWVYPRGQSVETRKILQESGFRLFSKVPCMSADLNNVIFEDKISRRIRISFVNNKDDLRVWEDTSFYGFEMPSRNREQYGVFISSFFSEETSPQRLFIAYLDEKPAATSLLFVNDATAGIYYVSTIPSYRNKGCGLAITFAAMRAAKELGLDEVILQATPMGAPIYHKAGFRHICQADIYKLDSKML